MSYYAINGLTAIEYNLEHPLDVLTEIYEHVIERSHHYDNNGNRHYEFNFVHGGPIRAGKWTVLKLYSFSAFNPREIVFNIMDPSGMTERDVEIINIIPGRGSIHFLSFQELNVNTLNNGLAFLQLLSKYKNWYQFLLSGECGSLTSQHLLDFRNQHL